MRVLRPDMSSYLVCSEPNIWIFDGLLSEAFLQHVDSAFESGQVHECHQVEAGRRRDSRSVQLAVGRGTQEIVDVIRTLGHIDEVEPCRKLCISDVCGDTQTPHVDHINIDDISRTYKKTGFVDMGKQSAGKSNASKIVPTFSFVVYFNSVGGIKFPQARLPHCIIPGRRGRIVMFQNYIDSQRPAYNPLATHYGIYFDDIPKRVMAMGILANETPSVFGAGPGHGRKTHGLIYCPGVNDDGIRHDWYTTHHYEEPAAPSPPPPPPRDDLFLVADVAHDSAAWVVVTVRTIGGEEVCSHGGAPDATVGFFRSAIEESVNPDDQHNVELMLPDGTMLAKENDDWHVGALCAAPADHRKSVVALLGLKPDDNVCKTFKAWDADATGMISRVEFVGAIQALNAGFTDAELDELFAAADQDQDGGINWEEFLQWIFGVDMPPEVWEIKRPQVTVALKHMFPEANVKHIADVLDRQSSHGGRAAASLMREGSAVRGRA